MTQNFDALIDGIKTEISTVVDSIKTDPRLEALRKLQAALNNLEDIAGHPKTPLGALLKFDSGATEHVAGAFVAPDEFFGLEPLDAAKRYLKKVGPTRKSADFQEIVKAIRAGSGDPGNEDRLRVSLARSTFEVAKVGEDRFGLLEYYPHVKRGSPGRKKKGESEVQSAIETPSESEAADTATQQVESQGEES